MKTDSMLTRFQGEDGRRRLVDLLKAQAVVGGDATLAHELADVKKVRELLPGEILIEQKSAENELFFILSGTCRIFVNGREVAIRHAGQHVGEMVIVDPSLRRTATVIASEPTIVAYVDEKTFSQMADKNPRLWRALAVELCQRLNERRKFHAEPNTKPILFIGSSKEHLPVAEALASGLPKTLASGTLWSDGVFGASSFAIESLETQIGIADFASARSRCGRSGYQPRCCIGRAARQRRLRAWPIYGCAIKIAHISAHPNGTQGKDSDRSAGLDDASI
jgi:CRP-like cAMP-binding protein